MNKKVITTTGIIIVILILWFFVVGPILIDKGIIPPAPWEKNEGLVKEIQPFEPSSEGLNEKETNQGVYNSRFPEQKKEDAGKIGYSSELPECPAGAIFNYFPVDKKDIVQIIPVGLMVPPDHTFPAPHAYIYVIDPQHPTENSANLYAPSDMTLKEIGFRRYKEIGPFKNYVDYTLTFSVCKDFDLYFIHVKSLIDPEIAEKAQQSLQKCNFQDLKIGDWCSDITDIKIKSGELIGTIGDAKAGIVGVDIGARDYRINGKDFIRPERNCDLKQRNPTDRCYSVCFFDYLKDELKSGLKFSDLGIERTTAPKCGSVYYDLKNTVQGNWFKKGLPVDPNQMEDDFLFLGPDYLKPEIRVFSVGSSFSNLPSRLYFFNSKNSDYVNTDFKDVIADGNIHCYELKDAREGRSPETFVVILQLTNENTLNIERLDVASCSGTLKFSEPLVFER